MSDERQAAIDWLAGHGGDAEFAPDGSVIAGEDTAPVAIETWQALRVEQVVTFYGGRLDGQPFRIRLRSDLIG